MLPDIRRPPRAGSEGTRRWWPKSEMGMGIGGGGKGMGIGGRGMGVCVRGGKIGVDIR